MRVRPLVLLVVALQLALPLGMLAARWAEEGPRPVSERPGSWQMYSAARASTYTGVRADGVERPLDVAPLPPVVRGVGTGRVVPDRLCRRDPGLVLVRRRGGTQPGDFRC